MNHKTDTIRKLNDDLRINAQGGMFLTTPGVHALEFSDYMAVIRKMKSHDEFTEDNDPHGEHDFGVFEHKSVKYFWKIDYYAQDMLHGSEDPADPAKTKRVLTLTLASEY